MSHVTAVSLTYATIELLEAVFVHAATAAASLCQLIYDWQFTASPFVLATSPLRLTTSNFIFQVNIFRYSPLVTFSLTRERVCSLQLLLVLASAVILRPESRGTHDHILLSQIRASLNLEVQVTVFIISPRHWVSFSSPPATLRAMVESFDPAFNRVCPIL
jgi:hypothetical protein